MRELAQQLLPQDVEVSVLPLYFPLNWSGSYGVHKVVRREEPSFFDFTIGHFHEDLLEVEGVFSDLHGVAELPLEQLGDSLVLIYVINWLLRACHVFEVLFILVLRSNGLSR